MNVTHCKTIYVRFTQHGHCAFINAAEFDSAQHERVDEPVASAAPVAPAAAPAAPAAPAGGDAPGHPIHGMNAEQAKAYAAALATREDIDAARAAEYAHPRFPGGRASVLKAIDAAESAVLKVAANATAQ